MITSTYSAAVGWFRAWHRARNNNNKNNNKILFRDDNTKNPRCILCTMGLAHDINQARPEKKKKLCGAEQSRAGYTTVDAAIHFRESPLNTRQSILSIPHTASPCSCSLPTCTFPLLSTSFDAYTLPVSADVHLHLFLSFSFCVIHRRSIFLLPDCLLSWENYRSSARAGAFSVNCTAYPLLL